MEGVYEESSAVVNQKLTNRDELQQEISNSDRAYQSQYSQNQIPNQPTNDRPTEIPAAKVRNFMPIILHSVLFYSSVCTHSKPTRIYSK